MKKAILPQIGLLLVLLSFSNFVHSQKVSSSSNKKEWFETISVGGYLQVRYNRLFETNPNLGCEQCDKSWGDGGGFFIRRARIKFSGNLNKRVYFYIQPDFASSLGTDKANFAQIKDAYFDISLDEKNEYRFRVGQSKVPFGFENMQGSQNRLPLDRADPTNSAVKDERDLGVFFYWAPKKSRELFSKLVKEGLKGSGDYGVFGLGVYNGQTANKDEQNLNKHIVARFSYPMEINNQIIEPGIQAYTGKYVLPISSRSSGVKGNNNFEYLDQRIAASFILYPKPFGIYAEYNIGRGPEFDKSIDSITTKKLYGGYVTASYIIKDRHHFYIPFCRYQYYKGGKKHEQDARSYEVKDFEIGVEWQPFKNFELVAEYTFSNRRYEDFKNQNNHQKGSLVRLQAQLNF